MYFNGSEYLVLFFKKPAIRNEHQASNHSQDLNVTNRRTFACPMTPFKMFFGHWLTKKIAKYFSTRATAVGRTLVPTFLNRVGKASGV